MYCRAPRPPSRRKFKGKIPHVTEATEAPAPYAMLVSCLCCSPQPHRRSTFHRRTRTCGRRPARRVGGVLLRIGCTQSGALCRTLPEPSIPTPTGRRGVGLLVPSRLRGFLCNAALHLLAAWGDAGSRNKERTWTFPRGPYWSLVSVFRRSVAPPPCLFSILQKNPMR